MLTNDEQNLLMKINVITKYTEYTENIIHFIDFDLQKLKTGKTSDF
jgi:hypothetical protein